jgi:chorismate dehydratase
MVSGQVDIGLVPVGSLPDLGDYQIVSDYCIGADGPVRSVVLASELPVEQIDTILLDYQSRSTVLLIRVLANFFWKKEFTWQNTSGQFEIELIAGLTGGIVIGDRVFRIENRYRYIYDLSAEWNKYTGLPFVFAVWATRKSLPEAFVQRFNKALAFGISGISEVEKTEKTNFPGVDLNDYFTRNISYNLDDRKKEGMALFLDMVRRLPVLPE